ncbi:MAG: corrinoid protein, partial [Candidatus Bathyarchaeia archaeon]
GRCLMMVDEEKILASLRDAIVNLDIDGVKKAAGEALEAGIPAYKAVVDGMAKGMEIVGQKYEAGEYFLAELIMAGETMKEGMSVLEPHLKAGDLKSAGKVIIGTVKGDLHDIGKNIVVTLLKAANYDIVDLGVDVSPEKFVEAVSQNNPDIVAMSALLTTTMIQMENVIKELRKAKLRDKVKIIIGGAPITVDYAKKIGADAAARDAVEGVRICNEWTKAKNM